jgi:hypothetical protein
MDRFLLTILALIISSFLHCQILSEKSILKHADDFTITTTDGVTRNLYNTLDSGKTVFVDLFYTSCYYCQLYAPIIEEIYQNTGAGQGDIEFWGISNNLFDTNNVIDEYKLEYNVNNPCAGPWGGGTTAFTVIVNGQNFTGFPTYCVICPDRTLYFDPCYPPTVAGFDPFFESCDTLTGINNYGDVFKSGIFSVYPNPASSNFTLKVCLKESTPLSMRIYNILGINIYSLFDNIHEGINTLNIPVDKLPAGTYIIKLTQNSSYIGTTKMSVSR